MSSKAKSISKHVNDDFDFVCSTTLLGSLVKSIIMITGNTTNTAKTIYNEIKRQYDNKTGFFVREEDFTIKELADYVWNMADPEEDWISMKDNLAIIYDENNILSPIIHVVYNGVIHPLNPKGIMYGASYAFTHSSPHVYMETLYGTEESK